MEKLFHEVRDPIHVFIRLDKVERQILNSAPLQRLRNIHQLALSQLVYPGATHKRLEHSLGVMHLAGAIFDSVIVRQQHSDQIREVLPEVEDTTARSYWRTVLRLAALCHDVGHLPFSHAAEADLLPDEWDHERLTEVILRHDILADVLSNSTPPVRVEDVIKLAVGRKANGLSFSNWEAILSEIVVGDVFGADRMDYLLRDSHHAGVAYGRFDHHRLIDTMQILPSPAESDDGGPREPILGIEIGGIQSAESLLLARYLMYSQVYFHPDSTDLRRTLEGFPEGMARWALSGRRRTPPSNDRLPCHGRPVRRSARYECSRTRSGRENCLPRPLQANLRAYSC